MEKESEAIRFLSNRRELSAGRVQGGRGGGERRCESERSVFDEIHRHWGPRSLFALPSGAVIVRWGFRCFVLDELCAIWRRNWVTNLGLTYGDELLGHQGFYAPGVAMSARQYCTLFHPSFVLPDSYIIKPQLRIHKEIGNPLFNTFAKSIFLDGSGSVFGIFCMITQVSCANKLSGISKLRINIGKKKGKRLLSYRRKNSFVTFSLHTLIWFIS